MVHSRSKSHSGSPPGLTLHPSRSSRYRQTPSPLRSGSSSRRRASALRRGRSRSCSSSRQRASASPLGRGRSRSRRRCTSPPVLRGRSRRSNSRHRVALPASSASPAGAAPPREAAAVAAAAAALKNDCSSQGVDCLRWCTWLAAVRDTKLRERLGGSVDAAAALLQRWPRVVRLEGKEGSSRSSMRFGLQHGGLSWLLEQQHFKQLVKQYRAVLLRACEQAKREAAGAADRLDGAWRQRQQRQDDKDTEPKYTAAADKNLVRVKQGVELGRVLSAASSAGLMPDGLRPYKQLVGGSADAFLDVAGLLQEFCIVAPFAHQARRELALQQP
ncbi:hypothetical protein COO60DRAFT_797952 [Scenedesmus sp. NREL 46B-D3]|nr:hypothetical protein COO60DRAFT_797952 [Scenedesmus sp. NREL 46B-D3]